VLVLACLGLASYISSLSDKNLKPLIGQPASAIIAKPELPTDEKTIAGQKVYIWSTSHSIEGGARHFCRIKSSVDQNEIIKTYDWEGKRPEFF